MTDKQIEEKKREFFEYEVQLYREYKEKAKLTGVYDLDELDRKKWQWIEDRIINPKPQTEKELFLSWFEETWDGWNLKKTPEEMWDWIETFKR